MGDTQKVAIVTGASRGIGRAVAVRLASEGFAVVVNYAGSHAEAAKAVEEIESVGGKAIAVQADVSKTAEVARLFDETEKAFGGIDVLVNNAGVMAIKPIAEFDDETFDHIFAINVRGTFNTLKQAAKKIRSGGRIINFSTSATLLALPDYSAYCASKSAVEVFTSILTKELRGRNVAVNTVAPGPVATELFFEGKTPEQVERLTKLNPFERLGRPDDIASVVAFLAGPDGAWVNGQTLRANGGMV
ncbi:MAG: SDR family oxidoreductase [Alloacidobacterium sp.]|jgi:3-oxoacyl-[acyl-carrier protein] reductase